MTISKKTNKNNAGEDKGVKKHLYTICGIINYNSHCKKKNSVEFPQKLKTVLVCDLEIPLLEI